MDEPFTVATPACSHLASVTQRGASNEDIRKDCVFTNSPSEPVMERDGLFQLEIQILPPGPGS